MDDFGRIQNLKARYCAAADYAAEDREAALARLLDLFTHDATADYGFGAIKGRDAVGAFTAEAIGGGSQWMIHNIHTPLIETDGDRATGSWTVNVRMKRAETGKVDFVFGRYVDAFRRIDGEWKIADVRFTRYE